jgi:hypothetical protein
MCPHEALSVGRMTAATARSIQMDPRVLAEDKEVAKQAAKASRKAARLPVGHLRDDGLVAGVDRESIFQRSDEAPLVIGDDGNGDPERTLAATAPGDLLSSGHGFLVRDLGGRDRSNRLEGRLRKVWDKAEDGWNPPLREAIDVRERLEALSYRVAEHRWPVRTAITDRAVGLALVQWAHEVGVWTLDAGTRELGLRANVAHSTAKLALRRLAASGLIRRDKQERKGNHSQRWALDLGWGLNSTIGPYEPLPPPEKSCGLKMEYKSSGVPPVCFGPDRQAGLAGSSRDHCSVVDGSGDHRHNGDQRWNAQPSVDQADSQRASRFKVW